MERIGGYGAFWFDTLNLELGTWNFSGPEDL
jgi:hypothetical protein